MSSYFAINSRAVLNFFNPIKSKQFVTNYMLTTVSLRENEPHSVGCLRSVNLVLIFESIFQLYLYFCPSSSHRLIFFDCLEQSNNFPDVLKCNLSAILLMTVHLFHVMYVRISSERGFELFYNYYVHGDKTFVHAPRWQLNKLVVFILNLYQVLPVACVVYLCLEYRVFTLRILGADSQSVWPQWLELVSMSTFFVPFASALCLLVFISYTCIAFGVLGVTFLVFRFRETHRLLSSPYCRLTAFRLLRFVRENTGTMQFIFSLNRVYGSLLLVFISINLPSNLMTATYLLKNRFSPKQRLIMSLLFAGQLSCFLGAHLMAAAFNKRIHSPYKRIISLSILIRRCPLRARIHLANAIQAFHVRDNMYGITYGSGKWSFGLVTMMSFTRFLLLYGKQLMLHYNQLQHSS